MGIDLFPAITAAAAFLVVVIIFQLWVFLKRRVRPLEVEHREGLEARRKKLEPFIAFRISLYCNNEWLDTLYRISQTRNSSMELDTIARETASESGQKLGAKIASLTARQTKSEKRILRRASESPEMKYQRVLECLCDNGQLVIGLEEPRFTLQEINQLVEQSMKTSHLGIPFSEEHMRVMLSKINNIMEKKRMDKEVAVNEFLLIKGNFTVNKGEQMDLVLKNDIEFHVHCSIENYLSHMGKDRLMQGASIPASAFGIIREMSKKEPKLVIDAISINTITLPSGETDSLKGV